jgi:hypothetical protein
MQPQKGLSPEQSAVSTQQSGFSGEAVIFSRCSPKIPPDCIPSYTFALLVVYDSVSKRVVRLNADR